MAILNEHPDLLFFDTFSHDNSEELNLDLVQFPKSVYVREIRIIPLGARVEGDFPGGVRLGATNPTKFHIDFFVNDLSKPGASTFESLGSLEYCQNGQIHMECGANLDRPRIPTDGLVLRGWYTTITLAVYGNLTQVLSDTPVGANPPPTVQRTSIPPEVVSTTNVPPALDWNPEPSSHIPTYTTTAASNPDAYGPSNYPSENYDNPMYRNEYYESEPPKDPRTYHQVDETEWEKDQDLSCEREGERLRRSPRSIDTERDRDRREGRSRRRSIDRDRSRETSRLRDRSRDLDRLERLHSRSRSRDRDYMVKGEYRPLSRSRSRSVDRDRIRGLSSERDWDRASYKKDDYSRHRDNSYDRSRAGSYEKRSASYERRSPYDKRGTSYERKPTYEKRAPSYEKRLSPYDKRASSFERRAPSYEKQTPYDKKRHSPYSRIRDSSYGSRSPSRDDPRKRPRTPPADSNRRPLSPKEGENSSPVNSSRSEDGVEYEKIGKQIPRVDFYHQSYRHKSSIRSPSEEVDTPFVELHSSLVTVPIIDNATEPKVLESPSHSPEEDRVDVEPFEPILSDEDICDDLEGASYIDGDYDLNDYCGVDDIIKYYNPFKEEWIQYDYLNKIHLVSSIRRENVKDVLTASFKELCDASTDLFKISEMIRTDEKRDQISRLSNFSDIDNSLREDWVHQCEQLVVYLTGLFKNTDIALRIFENGHNKEPHDEFSNILNLLINYFNIGLNFDFALAQQQPTYKIRHMKCGIRFAETLFSHKYSGKVTKILVDMGIHVPLLLFEMYSKEYMALSIRLMIMKALNGFLSSREAVEQFMKVSNFPKFNKSNNETSANPRNGYQALISIMQTNPLARIKFSLSALIKKLNMYELLEKLHQLVLSLNERKNDQINYELTEKDTDFIINAFDEILYMYRTQCFYISQPKRFLPVSAQFEITKNCSNETLLEFFNIHRTLEVCLYLLTCPGTCNNLVIVSPIYDLIYELVYSQSGIDFLYKNIHIAETIFKTLTTPYGQQNPDEVMFPHDSNSFTDLQVLGLELAHRLKTIYHLHSISDSQMEVTNENELTDRLLALYCLAFGRVGKTAVPDVIVMGENAECLMRVFERDSKGKIGNLSPPKQKSPAKGYAIELIAAAVRYSADVPFLKRYGRRLIDVCGRTDRFEPSVSSALQEIAPYLNPIDRPDALTGDDVTACVELLKANIEHAADLPGELTTCLRVLRHLCVPEGDRDVGIAREALPDEHAQLKHKYNALQLYSLDGVAHLTALLDRLVTRFDQPSVHAAFLASARGLQLAQLLTPCLRLLDEIVARVVRCRGADYRDATPIPVLLRTYGLASAFPVGCVARRTAAAAAEAAVRALLAHAQPAAEDATEDAGRRGPWTALCAEAVAYATAAPYTFVPGLMALSELLPLPPPLQATIPPTERELADAAAERRLWAAHLLALGDELAEMVRVVCTSASRPAAHMLRRVCVQVAELAPGAATAVARAAVGAAAAAVAGGGAGAARALGFLACVVSHAPVKCATLAAGGSELAAVLGGVLRGGGGAAAQEMAAGALAALWDAEVALVPVCTADAWLAAVTPSEMVLSALLDASADCLRAARRGSVANAVLRAYFVLTEHEFGFRRFRRLVGRRREALGEFFTWVAESGGEERGECLALYVDLIRILRTEEGEGPLGRKSKLTADETADMLGYSPDDVNHPILTLESTLKEKNADEDVVANVSAIGLALRECGGDSGTSGNNGGGEATEMTLPPPPPLARQFAARATSVRAVASDERLTATYWLSVPPPVPGDDDQADADLVSCDITELANSLLSGEEIAGGGTVGGGAEALGAAVRRLAGCREPRAPSIPTDDKRPPVAVARAREAGDAFRSRPPNTSRPPSLHVDDFTALHHYTKTPPTPPRGRGRGRFAPGAHAHAHPHYRQLRGRGAWEMGSHFGHFPPGAQYMMGGGWGAGRMQRGPRHRNFMR